MISIVIPTRNEEKIIERTLSAFKNNFTIPHEIIVSDGNSTDRTQEIARKYADKVVIQDPTRPRTIAEGRNEGAAVAQFEYIVFLDADCTIPNIDDFFHKALDYFDTHPKIVCLVPAMYVEAELATILDKVIFFLRNWTYYIANDILSLYGAPGEFLMLKKNIFDQTKGFRADMPAGEDIEFIHRVGKLGDVTFRNNFIVYHTGRRAHEIGWFKLLWQWFINTISLIFRKKAASKEWTVIR
jgi:glycosyltransferase involved in cell wall biosynthesis